MLITLTATDAIMLLNKEQEHPVDFVITGVNSRATMLLAHRIDGVETGATLSLMPDGTWRLHLQVDETFGAKP